MNFCEECAMPMPKGIKHDCKAIPPQMKAAAGEGLVSEVCVAAQVGDAEIAITDRTTSTLVIASCILLLGDQKGGIDTAVAVARRVAESVIKSSK